MKHDPKRRRLMLAAASAAAAPFAHAQGAGVAFMTAGEGSAFLPYGRALAKVITAGAGTALEIRTSGGSNENLDVVDREPLTIGTAFMGSVYEAVNGIGFASGRRHENVRALFPMYETSFQTAALRSSRIARSADLDGKRVGVGPANGPAEGYFRGLAEVTGIKPVIITGAPAALVKQLVAGEIDALWQGAVVPIPSLVDVQASADAVVFGLTADELARMRKRFPFMSPATVPPGRYKGQDTPLLSVAAWNFVVAHRELPEPVAYAITRAVLTANDLVTSVGPAAAGTRAANAVNNTFVPFHPGALRALRELGVTVG